MSAEYTIACFITSHGFGHAARTCAILNELAMLKPGTRARLFTEVPGWFFNESLQIPHTLISCKADVGLVQRSVFAHDVSATLAALVDYFPLDDSEVDELARQVEGCNLVFCDVSSLGIAVAKRAGLKAVLFENFSWDWVYEAFLDDEPRFADPIDEIRNLYGQAYLHIQSEPVCQRVEHLPLVPPSSRGTRCLPKATREQLGVEPTQRLVLVSRGGNPEDFTFLPKLKNHPETVFLFAGGVREIRRESNLLFIPYQTEFFHPDLVHAADLVVGKAGYSMIAEIWASGTPFVYVLREGFRESPILDLFLKEHISSQRIADQEFEAGCWVQDLDALLALPRREPRINGATEAAHIILS